MSAICGLFKEKSDREFFYFFKSVFEREALYQYSREKKLSRVKEQFLEQRD